MIINPTMLMSGSEGDNEDMFIDLSEYIPVLSYSDNILDKEILAVTNFVNHNDTSNVNFGAKDAYISIFTENSYAGRNYSSHDICNICLCIKDNSSNVSNNNNNIAYYISSIRFKIPSSMKTYYENLYKNDNEKFSISWPGCYLFVKN